MKHNIIKTKSGATLANNEIVTCTLKRLNDGGMILIESTYV